MKITLSRIKNTMDLPFYNVFINNEKQSFHVRAMSYGYVIDTNQHSYGEKPFFKTLKEARQFLNNNPKPFICCGNYAAQNK